MPPGCQRLLRDFDIVALPGPCTATHCYILVLDQSRRLGIGEPVAAAQPNASSCRTCAPVGACSFALRTRAPGYPSPPSTAATQGGVHLTHQPCSSLGAPIRLDLMIEFISIVLKPTGDLKPAQNLTGAGAGMCATFHPRV
jgi:hypothetical protein